MEDVEMEGIEAQDEQSCNFQGAMISLIGPEFLQTKPQLSQDRLFQLKNSVKMTVVRQRSGDAKRMASNTEKEWGDVKELLWFLAGVEVMTRELNSTLNTKELLALLTNPTHNIPPPYPAISQYLIDLFTSQNWGVDPSLPPFSPSSSLPTSPTNRRTSSTSGSTHPLLTSNHPAPPNHPIYGLNGIMHHIRRKKAVKWTYEIEESYAKRSASVFGHNGLTVGEWWPLQIAALRDGAHGASNAGIAGTLTHGTYSIVLSSTYSDHNIDSGHKIFYSSPHVPPHTSPHDNHDAQALKRSIVTGLPVRVLRTKGTGWIGAPREGLRYDGLYRVTGFEEKRGVREIKGRKGKEGKGGKGKEKDEVGEELYLQFRLERLENVGGEPQVPIDSSRPTAQEVQDWGKVQDGYE